MKDTINRRDRLCRRAERSIWREFVRCCARKGSFGKNSDGAACRKVHLARIRMVLHAEWSIWREFIWRRAQQGPFCKNSDGAELSKVLLAGIRMVLRSERFFWQKFGWSGVLRYMVTVVIVRSGALRSSILKAVEPRRLPHQIAR